MDRMLFAHVTNLKSQIEYELIKISSEAYTQNYLEEYSFLEFKPKLEKLNALVAKLNDLIKEKTEVRRYT